MMSYIEIAGHRIDVITRNTIIVGAGAAAFNAADRLFSFGNRDIAVVCEDAALSTSRNSGSDKQTYYKLTLSGKDDDSVAALAQTLINGQCVDGDMALAEAANSPACFYRLCELGVPFPVNRYGEYVGYRTDHDPKCRATSAGPLTSKIMTEKLEASVRQKNIPVYSGMQVISVLTADNTAIGLLCLNLNETDSRRAVFTAYNCENIIYATGGPAGIYADSVYPAGHFGASGMAFEAGVRGKNLTEWQYGLASLHPRWNVSGTYMQVLPRFVSTDAAGNDEKEFLPDSFASPGEMMSMVFKKGYEWPFDVRRVIGGSSIIDILVYIERYIKNRRVYLDYRENPLRGELDHKALSEEAGQYLQRAGALFGKPVDRLIAMNKPAYDLYLNSGLDLKKDPLEIALCAQHNNGGLATDCWWQTNITGFFAVGEVCGSHGVYRPGGSALNAGQVGSMRAAQFIAMNMSGRVRSLENFCSSAQSKISRVIDLYSKTLSSESNIDTLMSQARRTMSQAGAIARRYEEIKKLAEETKALLADFEKVVSIRDCSALSKLYKFYDLLISQYVYLSAMQNYCENGGKSRGSALYLDGAGSKPHISMEESFRFEPDDGKKSDSVQEVALTEGWCVFEWRKTRPIPETDDFFENVWKAYRENKNIF